jgi:hypothetical protein
VGKPNTLALNASSFDAFIKIQNNNLLNPSQSGDSLILFINTVEFTYPGANFPGGGGGVVNSYSCTATTDFLIHL